MPPDLFALVILEIGSLIYAEAGLGLNLSICASHVAEVTGVYHHAQPFYWLRWGCSNFLLRLALNHYPHLCLFVARITGVSLCAQPTFFFFFLVLSIKPWASGMLRTHSTPELSHHPSTIFIYNIIKEFVCVHECSYVHSLALSREKDKGWLRPGCHEHTWYSDLDFCTPFPLKRARVQENWPIPGLGQQRDRSTWDSLY
jgi:hypothetical protein